MRPTARTVDNMVIIDRPTETIIHYYMALGYAILVADRVIAILMKGA